VLLDECVDRRLTADIRARTIHRITDLRRLIPELLAALLVARHGAVTWVGAEQRASVS
jgi:hypothetical protein